MNAHYILWFTRAFDLRCSQARRYGMWLDKLDPVFADRARRIHHELELERLERARQQIPLLVEFAQ